jgi:hypothetical protein
LLEIVWRDAIGWMKGYDIVHKPPRRSEWATAKWRAGGRQWTRRSSDQNWLRFEMNFHLETNCFRATVSFPHRANARTS